MELAPGRDIAIGRGILRPFRHTEGRARRQELPQSGDVALAPPHGPRGPAAPQPRQREFGEGRYD